MIWLYHQLTLWPEGSCFSLEPQLPHLSNEHYINFSGLMYSLTEMTHLTGLVICLHSLRRSYDILFFLVTTTKCSLLKPPLSFWVTTETME